MKKTKALKIIKKIIWATGAIFTVTGIIGFIKKGSSQYEDEPEQKNLLEGKRVVFIPNENEAENADGVRGHLEAVGESKHDPGFYEKYVKRGIDIILSFGGLMLLGPVFALIAIAIIIDDPGPVLFTQKRIGQNKKYFKLHKFRSMKMCTPHDTPTHMLENPEQYITKVGKFLREHSLDELPQIWDIFIGNMSVIGPRPGLWNQDVLTAERDKYGANDVKPGLTGWAQINGRDELEIPEKAKLDGEYVQNMGFTIDAKVFFGSLHVLGKDESVVEGVAGQMKDRKKNKKFLIVTNHSYMLWQFRHEVIEELLTQGEVVISTPFVGHEDDFRNIGCKLIETTIDRRGINPVRDLKLYWNYFKQIKNENPAMVITYSIKPNIYASLVCMQTGIPYCVNVQGLGSAFQKIPISYVVTMMYKIALRKAKTVFFENDTNAEEFVKRGIIKSEKKTILKGAGVNLEFYKEQCYPSEENGIHFLYLGRIMKEKGIDELFEAAKKIKTEYGGRIVFDLVGFYEDEYKEVVEQLVKNGIVRFHGFQSDPRAFYAMSHCVVLPSYHEGMSNVLLEAASMGRALICSDIPGCREAVEEGKNGYLCKRMDENSLYSCMKLFIELDENQRRAMGHYGRKKMEKEFDKEEVVKRTVDKILQ
ncbi:sugar transferase [Blautia sp.]|uniref:sugar transferase n=1 Tax=Blautia sp. TaxID=1955243 RepID=UPI003AB8E92A